MSVRCQQAAASEEGALLAASELRVRRAQARALRRWRCRVLATRLQAAREAVARELALRFALRYQVGGRARAALLACSHTSAGSCFDGGAPWLQTTPARRRGERLWSISYPSLCPRASRPCFRPQCIVTRP